MSTNDAQALNGPLLVDHGLHNDYALNSYLACKRRGDRIHLVYKVRCLNVSSPPNGLSLRNYRRRRWRVYCPRGGWGGGAGGGVRAGGFGVSEKRGFFL